MSHNHQKFLSKIIKMPFIKGHKHSEEMKKRLSKIKKDNPSFIPSRKGSKNTSESNEKRRIALLGKKRPLEIIMKGAIKRRGINAWNWKGGTSNSKDKLIRRTVEYKLWRTAVFERDNYTCVWCGERGKKLNADHIKRFSDYPELRFAIDNGRTLCLDCHKTTDTYGRMSKFTPTSPKFKQG